MCNYHGYEFGAGSYPDSVCINRLLWDADSGDAEGDGWVYTHGGDIPCPICEPQAAIEYWREWNEGVDSDDDPLACAISLVNDIRANRGEPAVEFVETAPEVSS